MKSQIMLVALAASSAIAQQPIYAQCGGQGWTGGTTCASGSTCQPQAGNPYYSQCLPGGNGGNAGPPAAASSSSPPASGTQGGAPQQPSPSQPAPSTSTGTTGGSGTVNTGACGAYSGDKTGYASTTNYYDGQEGACGCGTGGTMASWQTGGNGVYTAAGSQNLFGGSGSWCGSGCGQCYELTNVGYVAAEGQGTCDGAGQTITVMITNLCPANGNAQWCSQPTDQYGYGSHFDIMSQGGGPQGWNNPVVSYKPVACPGSLTSDFNTCQCASGAQSRARRGLMGADTFYPSY